MRHPQFGHPLRPGCNRWLRRRQQHRPRGHLHPGKPFLRPLLRQLPRCARLLRRERGLPAALSWKHHQRPSRRSAAISSRYDQDQLRLHARHHARLGAAASELGQRRDGWLCHLPHAHQRQRRGAQHGLLHAYGPALLLRAGGRLHDLRQLLLLGDRPHRSEPPLHHGGVHRPGRAERRPAAADAGCEPVVVLRQAHLHHHAGAASGAGNLVEGLHLAGPEPPQRHLFRQRSLLLQELPEPRLDALPERLPAAVPYGFSLRRGVGQPAAGLLGHRLRGRSSGSSRSRRCSAR